MDWDRLTAAALTLPGVTLGSSYGTPALRVGKKLLARLRDDGAVVLKIEDGLRETLLHAQPLTFFTTPHYDGYPVALLRLETADAEQITVLIDRAWGGLASAKLRRMREGPATV